MKITSEVKVSNADTRLLGYTEEEFDKQIYHELSIKFAQQLQLMSPLLFKAEEYGNTRYQIQGVVFSMETFRNLMEELQDSLSCEQFVKIRNIFNNII
jgi:hypothetical protein